MDIAIGYSGKSCNGSDCGGSGVVILTKKSKEGTLERVLPDYEIKSGKEVLYDGAYKIMCSSKN